VDKERFLYEINTVNKFIQIYCLDKHTAQKQNIIKLTHNNSNYNISTNLCIKCENLATITFEHIQSCTQEIKPKCRKCENPCYSKSHWKEISKIMRYSGIRLGFIKIKEKINSLLKK